MCVEATVRACERSVDSCYRKGGRANDRDVNCHDLGANWEQFLVTVLVVEGVRAHYVWTDDRRAYCMKSENYDVDIGETWVGISVQGGVQVGKGETETEGLGE